MACKFICDGCGKEERVVISPDKVFRKPQSWFGKGEAEDFQLVCSLECVDKLKEKKNGN